MLRGFNILWSRGTKHLHRSWLSPLKINCLISTDILRQARWNDEVVSLPSWSNRLVCVTASAMSAIRSATKCSVYLSAVAQIVQCPSGPVPSSCIAWSCRRRAFDVVGLVRPCGLRFCRPFLLTTQFSHWLLMLSTVRTRAANPTAIFTVVWVP